MVGETGPTNLQDAHGLAKHIASNDSDDESDRDKCWKHQRKAKTLSIQNTKELYSLQALVKFNSLLVNSYKVIVPTISKHLYEIVAPTNRGKVLPRAHPCENTTLVDPCEATSLANACEIL